MNRNELESDEARGIERDARRTADRDILMRDADPQTANAVAKIRREKATRDKRWQQWDALVESDEWNAYLGERGYRMEEALPPMPRADDAEFAAIGAMMDTESSGSFARKIACRREGLHRLHFRLRGLGNAFYAVQSLRQKMRHRQRITVDIVTVAAEMRALKFYDEGTLSALQASIESCPGKRNIRAYIAEIRNASKLRYLHWLTMRLAEIARGHNVGDCPNHDATWLLNVARNGLDEIENNGFVRLKQLFEETK